VEQESKHPFDSKTLQFNSLSAAIIPAIWPLLPESFRHQDYAITAVTAWMSIGNIVLRFLTKEALSWTTKDSDKRT